VSRRAVETPAGHRSASGTEDAFAAAIAGHAGQLRALARRFGLSPADADDAVQETLYRAWQYRARYQSRDRLLGWLRAILRNVIVDRARADRPHQDLASMRASARALFEPDPESVALARIELTDVLRRARRELPAEQRAVLSEVAIRDQTYRSTAAALGVPIGTVMSRLHRARQALAG